ncbi:hypothetical protein TRICI_001266 [Trichomonascus ciferrii]|uniref:Mannosyltransferase n=1 Tax=Trichomonascus ciferrii TaxID=44093 RepID=A0A642V929_9ASCO|nr:hypothetical protein TRICI_001266 [Trichomonascus ciferrii]
MLTQRRLLSILLAVGSIIIFITVLTVFHDSVGLRAHVTHLDDIKKLFGQKQDHNNNSTDTSSLNLETVEFVDHSPNRDPFEVPVSEPEGVLYRAEDVDKRVPATFISLVRNSELEELLESIAQLEAVFNSKFNYPWTFFNDKEFTEEFKEKVQAATSSNCTFVKIAPEDWEEPEWIDRKKAQKLGQKMREDDDVQHANEQSYKRMCRWNSGKFYNHPELDKYHYYWRVEPKTSYFCDIDYDVFAYMDTNDKDYGFVINLYDSPQSVGTLWPTAKEFFQKHPDYVHDNNALQWVIQENRPYHHKLANGYSTCHFWSNFEVGRLDFFRSQAYRDYFDYLDQKGGFFYERWGDAPVHSVALAMMTDKSRIHWFRDIGYHHAPYFNCPRSDKCRGCVPGKFSGPSLGQENCLQEWLKVAGTA